MKTIYRILRKAYAKRPFDGEGAYRFGGRWSSPGTRLVYTAEHLSLAMIEYYIHIATEDPPRDLVLVKAEVPDTVSREAVAIAELPRNWRATPGPPALKTIGDRFVEQARTAVLLVPSALATDESNWLINPAHPEFTAIHVRVPERFEYDSRFFQR